MLANCAARGLQASPDQSSVWSSVAKFLIPTVLDRTVSALAVVLGARHYLRAHPRYGAFQKAKRDLLVANFADGNTVVNLKNVALQLHNMLKPAEADITRASVVFDWDAELPPIRPWAAQTMSRTGDDALLTLPHALDLLRQRGWDKCVRLGELFAGEIEKMREECESMRERLGRRYGDSAELFVLAERYCVVHAAACCLAHRALSSWIGEPLDGPEPLLLCLQRLWHLLYPLDTVIDESDVDAGAAVMLRLYRENRSFGYRQFVLAKSSGPGGEPR